MERMALVLFFAVFIFCQILTSAAAGAAEPFYHYRVYGPTPASVSPPPKDLITLIINADLYSAISPEITQYIADLENDGWRVLAEVVSGGNADDVRELLKSWQTLGLKRGVPIDDVAIAQFRYFPLKDPDPSRYVIRPIDLPFMNLSGEWEDVDGDGVYEAHKGSWELDVEWGRIIFSGLINYGDKINHYKNYFNKLHQWRVNLPVYREQPHRALIYRDDDFAVPDTAKMDLIYPGQLDVIIDPPTTSTVDYLQRLQEDYEFVNVSAHGSGNEQNGSAQAFGDELVFTHNIASIKPNPFFYLFQSCGIVNYAMPGYENLAQAYLAFGNGLVAIGETKGSGLSMEGILFELLAEGKDFGQAMFEYLNQLMGYCQDYCGNTPCWYRDEAECMEWNVYGPVVLGDSTLRVVEKTRMLVRVTPTELFVGKNQTITVAVEALNGSPVNNVTVNLDGLGLSLTGTTGDDGKITFNVLPTLTGMPTVTAAKNGYEGASTNITVRLPQLLVTYSLSLNDAFVEAGINPGMYTDLTQNILVGVKGEVGAGLFPEYEALAGASVVLSGGGLNLTKKTNKSGTANFPRITPVARDQIFITIKKDGYKSAQIEIPVKENQFFVDISIVGKNKKPKTVKIGIKNLAYWQAFGRRKGVGKATVELSGAINKSFITSQIGLVSLTVKNSLVSGRINIKITKSGYTIWEDFVDIPEGDINRMLVFEKSGAPPLITER